MKKEINKKWKEEIAKEIEKKEKEEIERKIESLERGEETPLEYEDFELEEYEKMNERDLKGGL